MKTILVIEDNTEVRENIVEILELSNYKVHAASNGKEGIEMAKTYLPDLIICDIMMPQLDGYGVLHVLQKYPETNAIPFIFLTAKAEKSEIRKGMNLGADDYITKPFDDVDLLDAIHIRLKKNEWLKQEYTNTIDSLNELSAKAKEKNTLDKLIKDNKRTSHYKKKQPIYSEGNKPNFLFFIISGKVKTYKTNADGRDYIIDIYKEGDFIGYLNLLENSDYTESAMAMEDTELCLIPKEDFFSILYSDKHIAEKFIKMLANNLIDREERLIKLAYNSVRKRVAESLIMLCDNNKDPENTLISVSREDLASITGASKETVIRTLSDFKDEKLIEIEGSKIFIINKHKLINMKN